MSSLLATIYGPHGAADLELPATIPIGDLLPLLIEACVPEMAGGQWAQPAYWGLGPVAAAQPFPPARTLADCGIFDGAMLAFQDINSWSRPHQTGEAAHAANTPQPAEAGTGGIGIRWNKDALLS